MKASAMRRVSASAGLMVTTITDSGLRMSAAWKESPNEDAVVSSVSSCDLQLLPVRPKN